MGKAALRLKITMSVCLWSALCGALAFLPLCGQAKTMDAGDLQQKNWVALGASVEGTTKDVLLYSPEEACGNPDLTGAGEHNKTASFLLVERLRTPVYAQAHAPVLGAGIVEKTAEEQGKRTVITADERGNEEAGSAEVTYESLVVAKKGTEMLALYNTLSDPVDKESFETLARYCYGEVGGGMYKKVLINWYLPGQSKGEKPWAVSNFGQDLEVIEILDEEMVKKFPSVKRWQQPGHTPLPL